jgi:hypothetical protein
MSTEIESSDIAPTEHRVVANERLDAVAKTLTTSTVAVAGILTAVGLNSDLVMVALNNNATPILAAFLSAILAVGLSLIALIIPPRHNVLEGAALFVAVTAYLSALTFAVVGAAGEASGNGRPTITNVDVVRPGPQATLTTTLHADGVKRRASIQVLVETITVSASGQAEHPTPIVGAYLRPNSRGVVDEKVSLPFDPGSATDVQIRAWSSDSMDAPNCDSVSTLGPGCMRVRIPSPPPSPIAQTSK